jgi:hypothetical protein
MACDVSALAAQGVAFDALDKVQAQAAKVYLLALIYKAVAGVDLTNIKTLGASQSAVRHLPDYKVRSAYLQTLVNSAAAVGVNAITPANFLAAISDYSNMRPETLANCETYLMCLLTGTTH